MGDEKSRTKGCRSRNCEENRSPQHDRCFRHAPCARDGVFDPAACEICSKDLEVIKDLPEETRHEASEWLRLKCQFESALALTIKYKRPQLRWATQSLAALFPGVGEVAESSSSSNQTSASVGSSSGRSESELGQLTSVLQQLCAKLMPSVTQPQIPPIESAKRSREENQGTSVSDSPQSKRQRSEIHDSPRLEESDVQSEMSESEHLRVESFSTEIKSLSSQGWVPAPSNWQFWEQAEGELRAFESSEKLGKITLTPVENIEIKSVNSPNGSLVLWRSRKAGYSDDSKAFPKLKSLANSLASMSSLMRSSSGMAPKVELGEIRTSNISIHSSIPLDISTCSFEKLVEWWKARSLYSSAQPPSQVKAQSNTKFNIRWPAESDAEKLVKFLSGGKLTKADFPKDYPLKDVNLISVDHTARQLAHSAWTVSSTLDILANLLSAASTTSAEDEQFDSRLCLHLASQAVSGIAALMAPHAQHLVEEAVSKRLDVRTNAIPAKLKAVEAKLLSSEPFSQKPCGSGESFQGIVNEAQPMQVSLPPQFYRTVMSNQPGQSSSYKNNSYGNKSQDNRQGGKNWSNKGFFQNNRGKSGYSNRNYKANFGKGNNSRQQYKDGTKEDNDNNNKSGYNPKYNRGYQGKSGNGGKSQ